VAPASGVSCSAEGTGAGRAAEGLSAPVFPPDLESYLCCLVVT